MLLVVLPSLIWSLPAYSLKDCILIKQSLPVAILIPVSRALPFSICNCRDTFRLIDFIFSFFPLTCLEQSLTQFQQSWKRELLIFILKSPSPVLDCPKEPWLSFRPVCWASELVAEHCTILSDAFCMTFPKYIFPSLSTQMRLMEVWHFMSQLLFFCSPVNIVLCGAVMIASHPSFWCTLLFFLLTASAFASHPTSAAFLIQKSRNAYINLTPKLFHWHHTYKCSSAALDCCLQRLLCTSLACSVLLFLSPFLANCLWVCFLIFVLWSWKVWGRFSKFEQH